MNRRDFIIGSSALGATTLINSSCKEKNIPYKPKFKMGYQLYSIRDQMAIDPIGTLKSLKAMGYEDFELYGFDEENRTFYGYQPSELKNILDDMELTISSGHYGFSPYIDRKNEELVRYVDLAISAAHDIHSQYITWPWIAPEQRNIDTFKRMAPLLNQIGEQVKKSGLSFAYHNHGFEFENHNGEIGYDIILNETDPDLVKLQIDMYWIMHSSQLTPKEWIKKQPGRYTLWHIKDMDKVSRDYTELGNGSIDYVSQLPDPASSGLEYYYIEQGGNYANNSTESAAQSAKYMKEHLIKYL